LVQHQADCITATHKWLHRNSGVATFTTNAVSFRRTVPIRRATMTLSAAAKGTIPDCSLRSPMKNGTAGLDE
jgi:hypothetical protein